MSCKKNSRKDESAGNCTCGFEINASRFGSYTCCPELHEWAETAQQQSLSWPPQLGTIVAISSGRHGEDKENAHGYCEIRRGVVTAAAVGMLLFASVSKVFAEQVPEIVHVDVDVPTRAIIIEGHDFGKRVGWALLQGLSGTVLAQLTIGSWSDEVVVAFLPKTAQPGTYRLTVVRSKNGKVSAFDHADNAADEIDFTWGAQDGWSGGTEGCDGAGGAEG